MQEDPVSESTRTLRHYKYLAISGNLVTVTKFSSFIYRNQQPCGLVKRYKWHIFGSDRPTSRRLSDSPISARTFRCCHYCEFWGHHYRSLGPFEHGTCMASFTVPLTCEILIQRYSSWLSFRLLSLSVVAATRGLRDVIWVLGMEFIHSHSDDVYLYGGFVLNILCVSACWHRTHPECG
jgi:hypothetical protein